MKKVAREIFDDYLKEKDGLEMFVNVSNWKFIIEFKEKDRVVASYVPSTESEQFLFDDLGEYFIYDSYGQCV